jgi:DNA adenine methylase
MTAPPFAYFGSKGTLADRIVATFPAHQHYVEPYAGGLAVLLAKPRAAHETVNDLDQWLMTFWRVLRDRRDDLTAACALTPHSRAEHQAAYKITEDLDEVETARRVWVMLSQGRGGTMRRTGWRFYRDPNGTNSAMPDYLAAYVDRIPACAARLQGVSLECRPALEVIDDYGREPQVLLYVDPPYLGSTRSSRQYRVEMSAEHEHKEMLARLRECKASVVLSGYRSQMYDDALLDWHRVDLSAFTGQGGNNGRRVECLWSNREIGSPAMFDLAEFSGATR